MKDHNSNVNQKIKGDFVAREVKACFSYEMEAILKASINMEQIGSNKDLPDYEDIENLYGYKCPSCGECFNPDNNVVALDDRKTSVFFCPSCNKEFESQDDLEQEPQEVFEWWIVTEYLYNKLKEKGEPVLEWGNNYYWGRTCSGQAILLDGVISEICSDMEILEGQANDWSK